MPRKRRASTSSLDDEDDDYPSKYSKDDVEMRAPRNAANARERARMRVLSKAFCRLKTTLPWVPADTKLSKLDTLRLAATYIAHLRAVLREDGDTSPQTSLSLTLSWPFAIQSSNQSFSNSCSVSSTSGVSQTHQYYHRQHQTNEAQCYHPVNHQNSSNRDHETHQIFY